MTTERITEAQDSKAAESTGPVKPGRPVELEGAMGAVARPRWCWYSRLLLAASSGWLLFVVLQTFLSGRWWLMLVPDLAPPLVFLAVPVLLLVGIPLPRLVGRRVPRAPALTVTASALVTLVAGLPWSGLNLHAGSGEHVPPDAVRVLSWNTQAWGKHTDPEHFYQYLKRQRADVYLLQEYVWSDQDDANVQPIDKVARIRQEFPGYHIAVRGELVTLSRYPIIAQPRIGPDRRVKAAADWQTVYTSAKVLRTDLLVQGQVMSFYNVHIPVQVDLRYSVWSSAFYRTLHDQDAQRRAQYRGLWQDVSGNRSPLLIAGDFNTSSAMGDLRELHSHLHNAADEGDSFYPTSWNTRWTAGLWQLDWTFTSSAVKVYRYTTPEFGQASDHRSQLIQLTVQE